MGEVLTEKQAIAETIVLLNHYGFELEGHTALEVITVWEKLYPAAWLRFAVLEALYRGRYKKVSVEEILRVWEKWEKPKLNFNSEFETLISARLNDEPEPVPVSTATVTPEVTIIHHAKADSIERFQPLSNLESSDAYQKLKAIATQPNPSEIETDNKKPQ